MPRCDFAFSHEFRVRWSETDAQGIVFNARYLDYADVAITEYWRALGWHDLSSEPIQCHVKKATLLWTKPIYPDEMISVSARTTHVGNSSMTQLVEIHGSNDAGEDDLRAAVELVAVCVDLETHRPKPLPAYVRDALTTFDTKAPGPAK
jgi:acyl-CoA thioester hydrolase